MLNLSYTVEKEGNLVSVSDRLMISESQINNLMDSLVANGYTVEKMSVAPATL
jgi:biotin operon repressor